ncbi:Rrf2 family transcriptional regulator [Bacillus sp. EAC]|uniref:RrF2 family transcriptional regulator n=1 Tax=Bacillus sp. EAC TaxID=1978338 RepID=UPI000B44D257|nr:Rrf2 family transcriptional regulator [Bacillus sp. EAC]
MINLSNCRSSVTPKWFGFAIQALVLLSTTEGVTPSKAIARHIRSGVSFMRRIMAPLVKENIVEAREGRDGGYLLARSPEDITLKEVYLALQMTEPLSTALIESTSDCTSGRVMNNVFTEFALEAESNLLGFLCNYTLADFVKRANHKTIEML